MLKKKRLWIIICIFLILLITLLYLYNNFQSIVQLEPDHTDHTDPNTILTGTNSQSTKSNFLWFLPKWKDFDNDTDTTVSECNHDENMPTNFIFEDNKQYILDKNNDKHLVHTDASGSNYIINRKHKKQFGLDANGHPFIKYKKRKLCKHGHVVKSKNKSNNPNNPNTDNTVKSYNEAKTRGYLTLGDFNGTTIQEGFSYSALVAPFDSTNLVADACNNSLYQQQLGQYGNNAAQANNGSSIHQQCRHTCKSLWDGSDYCYTVGASQCSALNNAQNTGSVPLYNISFSDPNNGFSTITDPTYQIMCSATGSTATGATQFSNAWYNYSWEKNNDCLYNQRTTVQEMCGSAQAAYNLYSDNLSSTGIGTKISGAAAYGDLNGGYWVAPGTQTIPAYTNPPQYVGGGFIPNPQYNSNYAVDATIPAQTITIPNPNSVSAWANNQSTIGAVLSDLNTAWTTCNTNYNLILQQAFDDCSNSNTLIDSSGMINCNGGILQQAYIQRNETCAAAMTAATNTNDTISQAQINGWTAFDPSKNPFTTTYGTAQTDFPIETANCFEIYNDCNNQSTFLDSNGLTQCLGAQYSQAQNYCQSALGLATQNGDEAGWTTINNMWNDVSNNKLTGYGNTLQNVQIALTTANSTCQKQIEMYNIWQSDMNEALGEPCIPEQPVVSQGDIDIGNAGAQWSGTALQYIQSLEERIAIIQLYISNYPPPTGGVSDNGILTLNPANVTLLSTIGSPIFTITQGSTILATTGQPSGLAPVQSLKITLPSGPAGPQGIQGKVGPIGPPGSLGKDGPVGAPGQYEIPEQYYKAISNA